LMREEEFLAKFGRINAARTRMQVNVIRQLSLGLDEDNRRLSGRGGEAATWRREGRRAPLDYGSSTVKLR